jgi:hypothetical protein
MHSGIVSKYFVFLFAKHDESTQCHKQRSGSGHCGYYLCEYMKVTGCYKRHPELVSNWLRTLLLHFTVLVTWQTIILYCVPVQWHEEIFIKRQEALDDDYLLEIVEDICNFILDEVVHKNGEFFDPTSTIGGQDDCKQLREWESLRLGQKRSV